MKAEIIYEVINKLVGKITPVGAEHIDGERLLNLEVMTILVHSLIVDINNVGMLINQPEHSVSRAGTYANDFLTELGVDELES